MTGPRTGFTSFAERGDDTFTDEDGNERQIYLFGDNDLPASEG